MCAAFHRHYGVDFDAVTTGEQAWPAERLAAYIRELEGDGFATWETQQGKNMIDHLALIRWTVHAANAETPPSAPEPQQLPHFNVAVAALESEQDTVVCVPGDAAFCEFFGTPIYVPPQEESHAHDPPED